MSQKSDAEGTSVMDDQSTGRYATRKPESSSQKRKWGGDGVEQGRKTKRRDLGRSEWGRARHEAGKTEVTQPHDEAGTVSQEPALHTAGDAILEDRKPKRKVAVMIGYSGSGYKGMQINGTERTIEGDLFAAFVQSGAISKANADDPKKSGLVRCARTDKGVHAAGNVVSLKLIIEDSGIVQKINAHLSSQIRVWGIERTIGSFSCYQACDSRWYEYLIPAHSFLPPHPHSFLGKKVAQLAGEAAHRICYEERQEEVAHFWEEAEEKHIKPLLDQLDATTRMLVRKALYQDDGDRDWSVALPSETGCEVEVETGQATEDPERLDGNPPRLDLNRNDISPLIEYQGSDMHKDTITTDLTLPQSPEHRLAPEGPVSGASQTSADKDELLDAAVKSLRAAYISAKRAYRIHPRRLARIREALSHYQGTHKFHNYTVQKKFGDPSAKRLIKSFTVGAAPITINGTEWVSLKVHGQSFMMHQIRKMVAMVALVVRCGCPYSRIDESFENFRISIPKAPGLGLLLERPVFDTYNQRATAKFKRERIEFVKYEQEMEDFKQKEIYERIFKEEENGHQFHSFFSAIDNHRTPHFLYLTSVGMSAVNNSDAISLGGGDTNADNLANDSTDEQVTQLSGVEDS